ncbi:nucleotidyltransferase domain-containing protein [Candidatus Gottesmanbacteria bacterium]|nr:nucleotidyltransferase domain-containing protein [Candidatus Gottesmanbacteria bacterium]
MSNDKILNNIKITIRKFLPDKSYQAFLFGSRAEGTNRKFSDYDIGIMGKNSLTPGTLGLIEEELENSDIPYNIHVYLSQIKQVRFDRGKFDS